MLEPAFEWIGGDPAIDFHNTASWRRKGLAEERVRSYADLVAWGHGAGYVARPKHLLAIARKRPAAAARALGKCLDLRSVLHAVLTAVADGRAPEPYDLRSLNRLLSGALPRLEVARRPGGFDWAWPDTGALDGVLGPIAWSAARLLTSDEVTRLGRCANEDCGWLFVDRSRRHNRRWCEMGQCGSRAKARRYYARKREASSFASFITNEQGRDTGPRVRGIPGGSSLDWRATGGKRKGTVEGHSRRRRGEVVDRPVRDWLLR